MKVAVKIIKAVLVIVLTILIVGIVAVKIATSTILDEAYIHKVLQTSKYYEKLHEEITSNFENYIGPSGLDENILKDVCKIEDIQKDTEIILGNIYEGTEKKVSTDEIKNRVTDKINKSVQESEGIVTEKMQASINKFAEAIAEEYIRNISHTEYEQKINDGYKYVKKIIDFAQRALFIGVLVIFILFIILNIKNIYILASNIGISLFSSGVFLVLLNLIVNNKIKIEQLKVLNNSVSNVLQKIVTDILGNINQVGLILVVIGIVAIIIGNACKVAFAKE